jgi:hypothetical protein
MTLLLSEISNSDIMKTFLILMLAMSTAGCAFGQAEVGVPHEWTATIKVVDDNGQPVEGANVSVSYSLTLVEAQNEGKDWDEIKGLTDMNGAFSSSHTDRSWSLGIDVQKSGYYPVHISYQLYVPGQLDANTVTKNRNSIFNIVLKKIGHPIPMYARMAQIEIPALDQPIGFDLIEYDWVAPYGKGKQSDIIFEAHKRWVSRFDFDANLKITFPNSGDGLIAVPPLGQVSGGPQLPVMAPLSGYTLEYECELSDTPAAKWKDNRKDQNYFFCVRTASGALYGKIYGDFTLDPINSKTTWILFTYYLNPTPNDRNVEFDPKHNLFKLSRRDLRVTAP